VRLLLDRGADPTLAEVDGTYPIWLNLDARWSSAEWLVLPRVYEGRHDHVDGRCEGRACGLPPPAAARWARGRGREGRQGTHGALQVGFTIHRHGRGILEGAWEEAYWSAADGCVHDIF
jgi:hypothetical protein